MYFSLTYIRGIISYYFNIKPSKERNEITPKTRWQMVYYDTVQLS